MSLYGVVIRVHGLFVLKGGPYFYIKVNLPLQDSGPFFVRAVLPNLPNPTGCGPGAVINLNFCAIRPTLTTINMHFFLSGIISLQT